MGDLETVKTVKTVKTEQGSGTDEGLLEGNETELNNESVEGNESGTIDSVDLSDQDSFNISNGDDGIDELASELLKAKPEETGLLQTEETDIANPPKVDIIKGATDNKGREYNEKLHFGPNVYLKDCKTLRCKPGNAGKAAGFESKVNLPKPDSQAEISPDTQKDTQAKTVPELRKPKTVPELRKPKTERQLRTTAELHGRMMSAQFANTLYMFSGETVEDRKTPENIAQDEMMEQAFINYAYENPNSGLTPGWALLVMMGQYTSIKMSKPAAQVKIVGFASKLRILILKARLWSGNITVPVYKQHINAINEAE